MALHYTDTNSSDRSSPSVSAPDIKINPQALNTASISPRAVGTNSGKVTTKNDQIIANNGIYDVLTFGRQSDGTYALTLSDGSNARLLVGTDSNGNVVFKISAAGYDASTASDPHLIYSSLRNTLQVLGILSATVNSNTIAPGNVTDTATVDISAYGLSATPLIFAFYTTGVAAASLGSSPFGGTVIEFIGGTGTLNAFSILSTAHTSTSAVFSRKFINNSGGSLTVPKYNIVFMVCTQTAN